MCPVISKNEAIIGREFPAKLIPLIDSAKSSISILVFDWRWYPDFPESPVQLFNQSIVRAVRRGVKVRAVLNMPAIVSQLTTLGVSAKKVFSKDLLHTKLIIIDNNVVVIGSHNYTQSAFEKNFECSFALFDSDSVARFISYFEAIFNYHGENISY